MHSYEPVVFGSWPKCMNDDLQTTNTVSSAEQWMLKHVFSSSGCFSLAANDGLWRCSALAAFLVELTTIKWFQNRLSRITVGQSMRPQTNQSVCIQSPNRWHSRSLNCILRSKISFLFLASANPPPQTGTSHLGLVNTLVPCILQWGQIQVFHPALQKHTSWSNSSWTWAQTPAKAHTCQSDSKIFWGTSVGDFFHPMLGISLMSLALGHVSHKHNASSWAWSQLVFQNNPQCVCTALQYVVTRTNRIVWLVATLINLAVVTSMKWQTSFNNYQENVPWWDVSVSSFFHPN